MEILFFILGLVLGSFANVCIYRLPAGKSIVTPGSQCPKCGKNILWYDNIPLLSYILLRGKCRFCKAPISFRYFIVELLTGVLFLLTFLKFGVSPALFVYLIFVLALIIVSFIDIDTFLIPDVIVLPGILLGLIFSVLFPQIHQIQIHQITRTGSFLYSLEGVLLGGLVLLFLGVVGKFIFKKEAMGGGDVKLLAMIGAFLGWKCVLLSLFFGSLLGTVVSLSLIVAGKKKIEEYVPFGPYLGLGAVIALFFKWHTFLGFFIN
jgi:leader peptidase (prepilin peptidase) / N-methyltransferase